MGIKRNVLIIILLLSTLLAGCKEAIVLDENGYCVEGQIYCYKQYYCIGSTLHSRIYNGLFGTYTLHYCVNGTMEREAYSKWIPPSSQK